MGWFSAINAKTLTVTFNTAISAADQAKVTLATKRGAVNVSLTPTWAADGKSVALTSAGNLTAGTYTVIASGLEFGVDSATTTVTARTATTIGIDSNNVTIANGKTIVFAVKDQYGVDMLVPGTQTGLVATAYDRTAGTAPNTKGALVISSVAGKSELQFTDIVTAGTTKDGDEILVTITYAGITTNKVIVARDVAALANFDLSEVTPVTGSTRITVGDTLEMPYTAVDQFGETAKLAVANATAGVTTRTLDGWLFTSSNQAVVDISSVAVDANGKMTFTALAEGTTIITAVNSETGAVTQSTVKVYGVARLDTFVISTPSAIVVAGEKVTVPYEAFDQYGEPILPKNLVTSAVTFTSTPSAKADLEWLGKELRINATAVANEVTLTATVPSNTNVATKTSSITVEVQAAATPAKITGVKDVSTVLSNNATSTVKATNLNVLDQYGRAYTLKGNEGVLAYNKTTAGTAVKLSQDATGTANTNAGTPLNGGVVVSANSTKYATLTGLVPAGTTVYVLQLVSDVTAPVAITDGTYDLSVQNQSTAGIVGYEIKPIGNLNAAIGNSTTVNALPITVVGKDAAGKDIALVPGTVTSLTVSNPNFGVNLTNMNVWSTVKGTATLTAWVGSQAVATAELTSVEAAPVATTVTFGQANYVLSGLANATSTTVQSGLTVKDQFGNTIAPPVAGTWVSSDTAVATVAAGTITLKTNGSTTITFISSNGISTSTTVEVGITIPTPLTSISAITGASVQRGVLLTAGTVAPAGATVTYQWMSATTAGGAYAPIAGATNATYTPVVGDVGNFLQVVVTGTGNYSGTATSAATTVVLVP